MTISYLPKEVLSSPVNKYYFLWAPLKAAWHNFKIALNTDLASVDRSAQSIAKNTLKNSQDKQIDSRYKDKAIHLLTHTGIGLSLVIPGLNYIPFSYLVIKAKENLTPKDQTTPLAKVKIDPLTIPKKNQSNPPPSLKQTQFIPRDQVSVSQPVKSLSSPRVKNLMKTFEEPKVDTLFNKQDQPVIKINGKAIREVKELELNVAVSFFVLFPEESPHPTVRKSVDKFNTPVADELSIFGKLVLNSNSNLKTDSTIDCDINKSKLQNAEANLKTLQGFLVEKFENVDGCYLQRSAAHKIILDQPSMPLGEEKTNPFEVVKKSIFSCSNEGFISLLNQYDFIKEDRVIKIKIKNLG